MSLEAAYVAAAAAKAWDADLGEGENEGADGFAVGSAPLVMVQCRGRVFTVNCFDRPYVDDPRQAAERISDLRLRTLFVRHTAWISCDAFAVDESSEEDVRDAYRSCGRLLARLMPENALAVFVPDTNALYPNDGEIDSLLSAEDPFAAIHGKPHFPVIEVSANDPRMQAAVAEARLGWPNFVAAFESKSGDMFAVKSPITRGDNTEFIWIDVTAIENDVVYGTLGNDPVDLPGLRSGSRLRVEASGIEDWCFLKPGGEMVGGFSVKVLKDIAREQARRDDQGA